MKSINLDQENKKVTYLDLQNILDRMDFYNLKDGYMANVDGDLTFFVSEPSFGGVYITQEKIANYLENWD